MFKFFDLMEMLANLRNFIVSFGNILFISFLGIFIIFLKIARSYAYNPLWYQDIIYNILSFVKKIFKKKRNQK